MQLLEFTNHKRNAIKETFGAPEYSYVFVRKAFEPILEHFGDCIELSGPGPEIDTHYQAARARGEDCVLLTFCPPNMTPLGQECPTVPVFAWEYDTLPSEFWTDDPRENWVYVLERTGMAITHCTFSSDAVRDALGKDFPVWTIPAPVFDKFNRAQSPAIGWRDKYSFVVEGGLAVSAGDVDLSLFKPGFAKEGLQALRLLSLAARSQEDPQAFEFEGVIYTSVLNPNDGRKNWELLISGFVWAFRNVPTAVLLVKLTRFDLEGGLLPVLQYMSTLGRFSCKVVLIDGLLSDEAYGRLVDATSYVVNTAYGEGQCLPLMEYMSAGRPAVAAAHSAMADYMSPDNAFTIAYEPRPTHWPHDERLAVRCRHNLVSFADLVRQYRESYRVARDDRARYARMSSAAVDSLRAFCSEEVAKSRMAEVMRHVAALSAKQKAVAAGR